ncbi:MAG TPA: hypothetical protein VFU19_15565 [Iamia sp.]|nr:hypothetical protein [Iamia sp.]
MSPGAKVGGFLAGLVLVGLIGAGIGAVAGPIDTASDEHDVEAGHGDAPAGDAPADSGHGGHGTEPEAPAEDGHADHGTEPEATAAAPGTTDTQDGYTIVMEPSADEVRFRITDPGGEPVVATEIVHEKPLHLVLFGEDRGRYAHLHPEVDADGTWSVARPPLEPDTYRVVADLQPVGGPALVLAGRLTVDGEPTDRGGVPGGDSPVTVDGISVALDGHLDVGDVELAFTATRDGQVVEPEPYLGARGHLVAFRNDDLAYSHVHPHDGTSGPVGFTATFPTAGSYTLFLELKVDGVVRTFAFRVEVSSHG